MKVKPPILHQLHTTTSPLHVALSAGDTEVTPQPTLNYATDNPTLNLDSQSRPLRFNAALKGPNRDAWIQADIVELVKLVFGTGTLELYAPSTPPLNALLTTTEL